MPTHFSRRQVSLFPTIVLSMLAIVGIVFLLLRAMAQNSTPAVPCTDSDGGLSYDTKGTAKGIYVAADPNFHRIFGQEPNPSSQKETTDAFSTYIDYCRDANTLDEGYCNASGYLAATGWTCPYGCSDGACQSPPANAPASISLSVQSAGNIGLAYRPGMRMYFSMTVTDTNPLKNVVVTTSPMMYSSSPIIMSQCAGKTMCEEKVYIIVPAIVGEHFITVTVTGSADQVSTKTVNFTTVACATDADCGGSASIQWAGATYCGSESDGFHIMQYGVAATCKSGGICDTSSLPRVKQMCPSGQACSMVNFNPTCIQKPLTCSTNAPITASCICAGNIYNSNSGYCCSGNGGVFQTAPGPCPVPSPLPLPSFPTCPKSAPNPYASCSCGGITYNTSNSYCCIDSTTGKEYQSSTSCPTVPSTQTGSQRTTSPTGETPTGTSATPAPAVLHPGASQVPAGGTLPSVEGTSSVLPSKVLKKDITHTLSQKKKMASLASKMKTGQKKIIALEKSIASLEKKIDGKLRFLEKVKKTEVEKRVNAQIDRWQEKIDALEKKKEKLEATMESLEQSEED